MSACERYEADLSALLDGELDAAREEELRAHMAGCPECLALYETFSLLHEDAQEPPADLTARIMTAVRLEAPVAASQKPKKLKVKSPWKPWLAAAAGFVIIVGAVSIPRLLSQRPSDPKPPIVRTMPQPDASASPEPTPETSPEVTPSEAPTPTPVPPTPDKNAGTGNTGSTQPPAGGKHSGGSGTAPVTTPTPTPTATPEPTPTPAVTDSGSEDPPQPTDRVTPPDTDRFPVSLTDPDAIEAVRELLGPSTPVEKPSRPLLPILLIRDQDHTIFAIYLDGSDVIFTTDGEQYYRCVDAAAALMQLLLHLET